MKYTEYQEYILNEELLKKACFFILCVACLVRIYFYIFPKDLWLDEAMIAVAIDSASWGEIFRGQFAYNQSCPLFFAFINKVLSELTSYSPHVIYFLPTLMGILLLVCLLWLCQLYERSLLLALICIALAAVCKFPLYYSSEFKQYIYEGLASVLLIANFVRDFHSKTFQEKIFSYKYPLLFSIAFLVATPSVFVSASIFLAIFLYLVKKERIRFFKLLINICLRYSIFVVICGFYYFLYLKNDAVNQAMYTYWERFFIPHDIVRWPQYVKEVAIPVFEGMFSIPYLHKIFLILIGVSFMGGGSIIYRKNIYEFIVFIFPFVFAIIAAFGIYPPGHGGMIGARLSFYLFPIIIFICSVGLFVLCHRILVCIKSRYIGYIFCFLICCFVLFVNVKYSLSGMAHQQTFSLFDIITSEKKDGNVVLVYSASEPALLYWKKAYKKGFDYRIVQQDIFKLKNEDIKNALPEDIFMENKLFAVYSHYWDNAPEKMEEIFCEHGYHVATVRENGATLQRISK